MSRMFTIKTVLATVSVALGIGFLVQIGETVPEQLNTPQRVTVPRAVTVVTNAQASSVFGVPDNPHVLSDHLSNIQHVAFVRRLNPEEVPPELGMISSVPRIDDPCKVTLSAMGTPAAMALVHIDAPCQQNEDFVISHESLRFSGRTDRAGQAEIMAPILAIDAKLSVLFDNVAFARTAIYMPDVSQYDRTVLQWRGKANLQLHVLESGASIGQPGHIWSGSSHTPEQAILGLHGFVVHYGSDVADIPYQAETYSYPARYGRPDMSVTMPIGVMVTPQNCGRSIPAQITQVVSGRMWSPSAVSIAVPPCDQIGNFVMLPDAISAYTRLAR